MRMDQVRDRKEYIKQIRKTFDAPERNYEWESQDNRPAESGNNVFFKVRLLLSLFILAAFILCDQTGTLFYHYNTEQIVEILEENYDYSMIKKYMKMLPLEDF